MASERAFAALTMRRRGAKYYEIANKLSVTTGRAYRLVLRALTAEARQHGTRHPTQAALDSVKMRRVPRRAF